MSGTGAHPLWVRSQINNAKKCLGPSITEEIECDAEGDHDARRGRSALARAQELLSPEETATHDWVFENLRRLSGSNAVVLTPEQWKHAKVRFADSVISDTVLKAFRVAELFAPRLQHDASLVQAVTLLNIMHDRLLGTDAMMDRPKVRYSVSMLTRHLGSRLGPMVGNSINAKRHPSEIFAHIALVFAADIWRLWADADSDPSAQYEDQSPMNWWRFSIQHAMCSMACDAATSMRHADQDPGRMVRFQNALAKEFDGGEVSDVLNTAWVMMNTSDLSPIGAERQSSFDTYLYVARLKTSWVYAEFIRSAFMTFRHGSKKPVPPPRWAGNFSERVYWRTAGDELWDKEFGHLFK